MSVNYVTTNIRLPKEMLKSLKLIAVEQEKSIAQLIRNAIEMVFINNDKIVKTKNIKRDSFFKIVGMYNDGVKDGSINHDHYLYGKEKWI